MGGASAPRPSFLSQRDWGKHLGGMRRHLATHHFQLPPLHILRSRSGAPMGYIVILRENPGYTTAFWGCDRADRT
jgi:hypothetical protein